MAHIKGAGIFYTIWILAFSFVIAISLFCAKSGVNFKGIAEQREVIVNWDSPVEIKRIHVLEGQSIDVGELLVELDSQDLRMQINQITHQLDQLKAQKGVDRTKIQSEISQLEAKKNTIITEILNKIRQLENQYDINQSLTAGLKSIEKSDTQSGEINPANPISLQIESLQQELTVVITPITIQIEHLNNMLTTADNPLAAEIDRLTKELALLKQQRNQLNIYAPLSGIIGSISYKPGEKVSPFAPILSLHTQNPSLIKGYIYETAHTLLSVGTEVDVASMTNRRNNVKGEVIGLGTRIVECPMRLRKYQEVLTWGREVTIKIPKENSFLLGEKVDINVNTGDHTSTLDALAALIFPQEILAENGTDKSKKELSQLPERVTEHPVQPIVPLETIDIEASGVTYLADLDKYIVISDDTPQKKPILFLVEESGKVIRELTIDGLDAINDMEAITAGDDGRIYISSSLSANKEGVTPESRKLLLSIYRSDSGEFVLEKAVNFHQALFTCAHANPDLDWAKFVLYAETVNSIEIEGMFFHDNALYFGFKAPLQSGMSVVLKIDNATSIFSSPIMAGQVALWKMFRLKTDPFANQERISDLFYKDGTLYISGVGPDADNSKKYGSLWRLGQGNTEPELLRVFKGMRPEGISSGKESKTLMVCFDQGHRNQSQMTKIMIGL